MNLSEGASGLTLADWLGVAATVVAVFGIVLAIVLYRRAKATKTLDYRIISSQSLTTNEAYPDLQIRAVYDAEFKRAQRLRSKALAEELDAGADWHGGWTDEAKRSFVEAQRKMAELSPIELTSPSVHTIEVRNTGKLEINDDMFKDPIAISIPGSSIVDASVIKKSRDGIFPDGSISCEGPAKKLTFTPRLMNAGDWLRIRVLADMSDDHATRLEEYFGPGRFLQLPTLRCWIVGETRPMQLRNWADDTKRWWSTRMTTPVWLTWILGSAGAAIYYFPPLVGIALAAAGLAIYALLVSTAGNNRP